MAKYLEIAAGFKRGLNWDAVRDVADLEKGVEKYDMRNLPMKGISDNTYDGVYSEHFIEHLHKGEGIDFLKEMYRVLKPGGTIRTIWPPREFIDKLLSDEQLTADEEYFCAHYHNFYVLKHKFCPPGYENEPIRIQCAQGLLYQNGEHLYVWGKKELIGTLKELGFIMVKDHEYQKSRVGDFRGIDSQGKIRALHSAVVEAQKPW
jgi:ubiquinone/menaquinone biosynthesis C-methylase UbiE